MNNRLVMKGYSVDFHYEVNGKMYEFSIPGGGFASFYKIVEVLGIARIGENTADSDVYNVGGETGVETVDANGTAYKESIRLNNVEVSEATRKFVADVASVEFSSPELVWVGKVNEETTIGGLKEANELEVRYSAELTEEQIAEINSTVVESGDWALISVLPFESTESLTVAMKTGEVFEIHVTDYQMKKTVIDAKGETWEITVTYDDSAEIPNDAELKVEEILPEVERYEQYYQQSFEMIGVVNTSDETEVTEEPPSVEDAVVSDEEAADLVVDGDMEEEEQTATHTSDYARIFDIQIWADDQEIQPKSAVTVNIKLLDAPENSKATPSVIHFAKDGVELMELAEKTENNDVEGIQFVTDEFSVYSVVYTVDFFFEVNGKVYGFNMDGADSVSLRALVEALHVYEAKPDGEKEKETPERTTDEVAK